jgi:oxygen-dependent protoporphyrinogen oxidase
MPQVDVVIVGAGIAGLATAYELSRLGVSFVVLERTQRAGGVILSEQIDGFTIDAGPDSLLIQKPEGIRLCQEIGLGDRLVATKPPRVAYIQRGARLHPLPAASVLGIPTRIGPFVRTRLFSWPGKIRMGAELFVPARREDGDESIASFITRRFGTDATEYLAEPLLAGIHAGDVDRLSMRALFPSFVEAERTHGSLLRAFRRRASAQRSSEGAFKSLPGGLSEMVGALVRCIGEQHIRAGAVVRTIGEQSADRARNGNRPPSAFRVETPSGEIFDARAVVVATPAYATAAIVRSTDGELASWCAEIRYSSTATVALAFRREDVGHPLDGSGFVVPRAERSPILAASWLSSKWPNRAPADHVLLRAFFGGMRDPEALNLSDPDLIRKSLDALRPLLQITGRPTLTRVYRWERANAQHEVGHADRIAAIEAALARHPGLFLTGSAYRGTGIPDCIGDGRATGIAVKKYLQ